MDPSNPLGLSTKCDEYDLIYSAKDVSTEVLIPRLSYGGTSPYSDPSVYRYVCPLKFEFTCRGT